MRREEIKCKILYKTEYSEYHCSGRDQWHIPYKREASIVRYVITENPLFHYYHQIIVDKKELDIEYAHTGIDGTVLAFVVKDRIERMKLYTDILTEEGKTQGIGRIISEYYYPDYQYNAERNPKCHVK